jgi:hypothetical protein
MTDHRRITLCADDFAADESVSAAILKLASLRRLSAVTCFADSPSWPEAGAELRRLRNDVLLGLHFNLTCGFGKVLPTLPGIALRALTRRIDVNDVHARLEHQIDRFVDVVGEPPDFIDGHEHVHAFPVIADIVRRVAAQIRPDSAIPIRCVRTMFGSTDAPIKRCIIRSLAALGAAHRDEVPQLDLNSGFAGDYSLSVNADFPRLMRGWLRCIPDRGLIMCHPRIDSIENAPTAGANEFQYLKSVEFADFFNRNSKLQFLRRSDLTEGILDETPSNELRESPSLWRPMLKEPGDYIWLRPSEH